MKICLQRLKTKTSLAYGFNRIVPRGPIPMFADCIFTWTIAAQKATCCVFRINLTVWDSNFRTSESSAM
jgi:hypothetical protein